MLLGDVESAAAVVRLHIVDYVGCIEDGAEEAAVVG
jgi:hypothetical protein